MRALGPLAAVLVALALVASSAVFTVDQRQNAIVFQLGEIKEVITKPGLHFKWPLMQNVRLFDMRILTFDDPEPLRFPTSGNKPLDVDSFVKWRITDVRSSARGYTNYHQWLAGTKLEQRVSLEDYSVSNRGLRAGLVGTPEAIAERLFEFEEAGIDLMLLQFSPQSEEMERFAKEVIPLGWRRRRELSASSSAL